MIADSAWDDASKCVQIRIDVDGDAMHGHPSAHTYPERCDLRFSVACLHPHADPSRAPFPSNSEPGQRKNHPFLEMPDENT